MTNTPERTPAEELRAVAKTLRETAAKATAGPWEFDPNLYWDRSGLISRSPDVHGWDVLAMDVTSELEHENARWAALVHPGLAEPLAELFDLAKEQEGLNPAHARLLAAVRSVAHILVGGETGA